VHGQLGAGNKQMLEDLSAFVGKHTLRPQIAQVFEFEDAVKGLEAACNLSAPGKVVIRV